MPPKLKYENVVEEFNKYDLILLDDDYINNNTKMSFMNSEGYKSTMKLSNLKSGKSPAYFSKFNKYTIENIQLFLDKANEDVRLLSQDFNSSEDLLEFRCSCGKIFYRSWMNLSQQKYTICPQCAIKKRGMSHRIPFNIVQQCYADNGYKLLATEQDYKNNSTYLLCEDKDGYRGFQSYSHLNSPDHKHMCRFGKKTGEENIVYNINLWAKRNGITSQCLKFSDKNKWTRQGIVCKCGCGEIFETSIISFMYGKTNCDKCSRVISRFELKTKIWLDDNNIDYIQQYSFKDCRNILPLPFDFYLPKYNILIEVDGQGHYFPCYFNNCSEDNARKSFELTKHNDSIKSQYCKEHDIKLIRIPYWEYNNNNYINILFTNLIKD